MTMQKMILYYKFTPIADPEAIRLWQKALCEKLNIRGRILISDKGINGTLGGDIVNLKAYVKETKSFAPFKTTAFKWSDGDREDFPRLSIKVRSETVTLGWEPEVDAQGVKGGGKHLKPHEVNELLAKHPDAVFFDGRNNYESAIGKFKGAITPDVKTFKQMPEELDKSEYEAIKDKPVITYCTGGIRCETLSALMKKKGFKDVYQIDGGIVKYGETFKDEGHWEGKLYVFDKRKKLAFSEKSKDIASCEHCGANTSNQVNCSEASCNKQIVVCEQCTDQQTMCPSHIFSVV
jgi:UPF0176 protein